MKGQYAYYGANGIIDFIDKFIFNGNYILLAEDGGKFDEFRTKPIAHKARVNFELIIMHMFYQQIIFLILCFIN